MTASIDVKRAIRVHLDHANRAFDAAMDELVPPTRDERLARDLPVAVGLAQIGFAFNQALMNFAKAFSTEYARLQRTSDVNLRIPYLAPTNHDRARGVRRES